MNLWLDLETAGTENLPTCGLHRYARDARILLNAWAVGDAQVKVEEELSADFRYAFKHADRIFAHNAEFDRTIMAKSIDDIRFDTWYCTMAQARRHGLPGKLSALCEILRIPDDKAKIKDGRRLLMLFCKPRPDGSWATKQTHPVDWALFVEYAGRDVDAMRAVHAKLPTWNDAYELPIWRADQRINMRGFQADVEFAQAAIEQLKLAKDAADEDVQDATGGEVASARQVDALLKYILAEHGVDLPDMTKDTIERRLKDESLPEAVRELLVLRQQSSKTSTGKYRAVMQGVDADGRMRGTMACCGAMRTKRWSGQKFQPHNLPRPKIGNLKKDALKNEILQSIAWIKADVFDLLSEYPITEVASAAIRGLVIPAPGKRLGIADYSNVEGRGLAWLAGEDWKLEAFRAIDRGEAEDMYIVSYSRAFGVPPETVEDQQRQVGKVMELMLGYGGGVGAFVTGAETYRLNLQDLVASAWPIVPDRIKAETKGMWEWAVAEKRTFGLSEAVFRVCDALKRMWREKHPATVALWSDLEWAFRHVLGEDRPDRITSPRYTVEKPFERVRVGLLTVEKKGSWVRIIGPAGDCICYPGARLKRDKIVYWGQNQYTRQWSEISTYGGKLAENVTQWTCRNLLAESILAAERVQLPVVLHVHDELVTEFDAKRQDEFMLALMRECMTASPWAKGLPLAVAAHTAPRYGKD